MSVNKRGKTNKFDGITKLDGLKIEEENSPHPP